MRKDTIQIAVLDSVDLKWQHRLNGNCIDRPSLLVQNLIPPDDDLTFRFEFGDGTTSMENEVEHIYENDGLYFLKFIVQKKICLYEETVQLPVYKLLVPNVFTPDTSPGLNDYFKIGFFGSEQIAPVDVGITQELLVIDRWGKKVFDSPDYKNDWNANGLESGVYFIHVKVGELATCKSWLHVLK